jgi:hypothetical protein
MVFFGVLAGFTMVAAIHRFCVCERKERFLRKYLALKHGISSDDTFIRVLTLIDLRQLETATVDFLTRTFNQIRNNLGIKEPEISHVYLYGKEARGTGRLSSTDGVTRNLQTLHVYDAQNGICLVNRQIECKTNEIPVAQEVLKTMNLQGVLVTFDAMHTQKQTISIIAEGKGYFLGGRSKTISSYSNKRLSCFLTGST